VASAAGGGDADRVKRHPRAYWERLVAEVNAGAAAASVARKHGVRDATLRWWCSRLRAASNSSGIRLVAVETAQVAVAVRHVEIACGRAILRVEVGTDIGYVAALAGALGAEC
jgi:transposase-like protein